jgi:phage terminase small subunit
VAATGGGAAIGRKPRFSSGNEQMSIEELVKEYDIEESPVPELTELEKKVALQFRWHQTFNAAMTEIPDDLEKLSKLIPPVSDEEIKKLLFSVLTQAKTTYLKMLNMSWTQSQLEKNLSDAGVSGALQVFDEKTQENLNSVIKYLPTI